MILDSQTEFSDSQAVTATAISTNVLDLFSVLAGAGASITPNTKLDIGLGAELHLVVNTAVLCTDAGSDATLTISLESGTDAGLTAGLTTHFTTPALAFAAFSPAGTKLIAIELPPGLYSRYLGVRYTVASGPLTAGAFDAFLSPTIDSNRPYKSGFVVQ